MMGACSKAAVTRTRRRGEDTAHYWDRSCIDTREVQPRFKTEGFFLKYGMQLH